MPDGQAGTALLADDASGLRQLLQKTQSPVKPKSTKGADTAKNAFARLSPKKLH
jgi:hypothetical protein